MLVVLFLCFLFFLSVSVTQTAGTDNTALKNQLERSITHISQILADAENKIARQGSVIAEIDEELNEVHDYGINVFWNSSTTKKAKSPKFGNFTYTIKTTPSLFPPPSRSSTYRTAPANWHLSTKAAVITDTPYITYLINKKETKHYGYCTSFLDEFSELLFSKNLTQSYQVASMLSYIIKKNMKEGKFASMGDDLLNEFTIIFAWFDGLPARRIQQQAGVFHHYIQIRKTALSQDWNNLIDYYDSLFTDEEGHKLYEALELLFIFPKANVTLGLVGYHIYQSFTSPFFRLEGTRKQKRLNQLFFMAAHDLNPYFRKQTEALSTKGYNLGSIMQGFPGRRSMIYEKVVKHFLRKHPKLFKKMKRQYKHEKKNKHHHFYHKQKRHHNYRKSRGGHHGHGHRYQREKITQRALSDKDNFANEEIEDESYKSDANDEENSQAYSQENIRSKQFTQTPKKQLEKLKQRKRMPIEAKPRQSKLLKGTRTAPLSIVKHPNLLDQADSQYLKKLAILFLRKRQQNKNFNKNRRLNIPSSEEDICDHSQFFEDSVENVKLHKIREASSYSDEEEHLRMNLYDALRHGNRTFVSFRKSNGDVIKKHTLRDLSSEADDEWILKKNIYKVFGQEK